MLLFDLWIRRFCELIGGEGTHHQLGGKRRTSTALPPRSWRDPIHLRRQCLEVNLLLHDLQHITQTVQFRFPFLGGKQALNRPGFRGGSLV